MNKRDEQLHNVAKNLMEAINSFSMKSEPFVNVVTSDHRSLQQSAFRLFLDCIKKWAEEEKGGWYDGRNEATVKACRKIVDMLVKENMLHIPFI